MTSIFNWNFLRYEPDFGKKSRVCQRWRILFKNSHIWIQVRITSKISWFFLFHGYISGTILMKIRSVDVMWTLVTDKQTSVVLGGGKHVHKSIHETSSLNHMSVLTQLRYTIQHRTVLIIFQRVVTARMFTGGRVEMIVALHGACGSTQRSLCCLLACHTFMLSSCIFCCLFAPTTSLSDTSCYCWPLCGGFGDELNRCLLQSLCV